MSENKEVFVIFTPNAGFTGMRNAGKHSVHFTKGIAQTESRDTAEVMCYGFGYLCPQLEGGHLNQVLAMHSKERIDAVLKLQKAEDAVNKSPDPDPDEEEEGGEKSENETPDPDQDGKVGVRFLKDEGIRKAGDLARFKADTAKKKVEAGVAEYADATGGE